MPIVKGSVFIESGQKGWTENFWLEASTPLAALDVLKSYVTQRRKLLSQYSSVKYLRVVNPDPTRDAVFFSYLGSTGAGTDAIINDDVGDEQIDAAINVRMTSAAGKWRNLLYRGLAQSAIHHFFGGGVVNPDWGAKFNANVRPVLVNSEFRIKVKTVGAPQSIASITLATARVTRFTTNFPLDPVPAAGSQIEIRDVLEASNVNGVYQFQRPGDLPNTYHVRLKGRQITGVPNVAAATARVVIPTYSAITDTQTINVTSRQTGRPSYQRRGRRSARRS